jgi:ankyrin repeat protein
MQDATSRAERTLLARASGWVLLGVAVLGLQAALAQAPSNPNLNAQLLVAARQGDLPAVKAALARGAEPSSRNGLGKTALVMALEKGQDELALTMLEAGTDVNLATVERVTPLMTASYVGSAALVQRLLAKGARWDPVDRMGKPAALYAAGQGQREVLRVLLDAGAPVNAAYENQLTALMWAAGQGHLDATRLLLARGADRSVRDDRGLTARDIALQAGHTELANLLTQPSGESK